MKGTILWKVLQSYFSTLCEARTQDGHHQSINQLTAETARVRRADLLCPRPTTSRHMWSILLGRPSCWAQDDRGRPLGLSSQEVVLGLSWS